MEINSRTQLCGLLGNPVEHSLSPAIHNAAFQKLGLNFVYLAFRVENIGDAIRGIRALGNMRGFSVTIPHKVSVLSHLDEVEPTAQDTGSVNTIVVDDGRLIGYNTDAWGALQALKQAGVALQGRSVLMLGSGGAARAIGFVLAREAGITSLTILGIDDAERLKLTSDLRIKTGKTVHEQRMTEDTLKSAIEQHQLLIHCTPIGMYPRSNDTCIPASLLKPHLTVMDIVYNPMETRLLKEAKAAGCRTVPGLAMFLNQAVKQFELWTGQQAPADVMQAVLESRLS